MNVRTSKYVQYRHSSTRNRSNNESNTWKSFLVSFGFARVSSNVLLLLVVCPGSYSACRLTMAATRPRVPFTLLTQDGSSTTQAVLTITSVGATSWRAVMSVSEDAERRSFGTKHREAWQSAKNLLSRFPHRISDAERKRIVEVVQRWHTGESTHGSQPSSPTFIHKISSNPMSRLSETSVQQSLLGDGEGPPAAIIVRIRSQHQMKSKALPGTLSHGSFPSRHSYQPCYTLASLKHQWQTSSCRV